MLNGMADRRESSSLSKLSHSKHCNVLQDMSRDLCILQDKQKQKAKEKQYLIFIDQIPPIELFKSCSGIN